MEDIAPAVFNRRILDSQNSLIDAHVGDLGLAIQSSLPSVLHGF